MKKTPNFIKADAQHLPFQNGAFHTVVSYHTIEHVDNPTLMLKEMLRVAKRTVMVVCPHRYSERAGKFKVHKNFLNKKWFVEVLKKMEVNIYEINYSKWRYFPHVTVPIVRFPCEMVTKIMKPRI
jgi:ubiquinone/menaquinone biosynthesis C-methylase UbiE